MRIIQVVPSIALESSGPSYSVPGLCGALAEQGGDVELHVLDPVSELKRNYTVVTYPRHTFPHPALGRSPEMLLGLKRACRSADIIHSNSLWMMPNIYPEIAARGTRCKLITMPRGTLSEWALQRSKWKKSIVSLLGQSRALAKTDMFVATCNEECREIRAYGLKQPIAVIPNGIEVDDVPPKGRKERRLVFLSRIHPTKGIDLLLRVWKSLQSDFPDWSLSIVGPDQHAYAQSLKELSVGLGCERVSFVGELNGRHKIDYLASSAVMVLPTHSENFGMVVAEALAAGIPVICSHGAPWKGLVEKQCGWWVPLSENDFAETMRISMRMPLNELSAMGGRGYEWMKSDFSWPAIGRQMMNAYEWLLKAGPRPGCVVED